MRNLTWIATTQTSQWQSKDAATTSLASECKWDVEAQLEKPLQTIDGFGACFNELGWTSLSALEDKDKDAIFRELFARASAPTSPSAACRWALTIFRETLMVV
jgi:glucosylceramidase